MDKNQKLQEKIEELESELECKDMCVEALKLEKTQYLEMLKAYEEELKRHMSEEKYKAFATKVAKTAFLAKVMASPNKEFKDVVFENWDDITKE